MCIFNKHHSWNSLLYPQVYSLLVENQFRLFRLNNHFSVFKKANCLCVCVCVLILNCSFTV